MSKLEKVKEEMLKYDYIRFAVCDINGVSRGQVVPVRHAAKYLHTGVDVFQGLLMFGSETEVVLSPHEKDLPYGNMAILPDLSTLRCIPWADSDSVKVAELLCESRWKKDNSPQLACPRYVARQQLKKLEDLGFELFSGFEMEYFLYYADTMEPLFQGKDYMDHLTHNKHRKVLFDFDRLLFESGVDVERFHSEYAPGQFEAVMKPAYGIDAADAAFNLKQGLQEISDINGLKTSFISKVSLDDTGIGNHFSFSLLSKETGENVFFDASSPDQLSPIAKHWIAGILKHSKALTVLCSPTPNCYRRLHQPWAPAGAYWAIEDRSSSLRVKNHGPSATYMENRIPSGKSNPYIVVAATVAAGLDGILNRLECPPQGTLQEAVSKGEVVPKSLPEAMKALTDDKDFVNALGEEFVAWFLKVREVDVKKFENLSVEKSILLEKKLFF